MPLGSSEANLQRCKATLGDDHPDTLRCQSHLADGLDGIGEYHRSLALHEDCLTKRVRILGDEHPDTLSSRSSVANVLQQLGEYDRALPLYEDCLAIRRRTLSE